MRKKRLLIIGCGDIALRLVRLLDKRHRLYALIRDPAQIAELRDLGITPILGDLDHPATLNRLAGLAELIIHTAPPPPYGEYDQRTANLLSALNRGCMVPQCFVYISTSGVYGDCEGCEVSETHQLNPQTSRAIRRASAERQIRNWGKRHRTKVCLLRAPGIYAANRLPLKRIQEKLPALHEDIDCFTNHIHAEDLAKIVMMTFWRGRAQQAYNASDNAPMKMGDYFDLIADHFKLPRPPRASYSEAEIILSPVQLSFMAESRRLNNHRLIKQLRIKLRYPSVREALKTFS